MYHEYIHHKSGRSESNAYTQQTRFLYDAMTAGQLKGKVSGNHNDKYILASILDGYQRYVPFSWKNPFDSEFKMESRTPFWQVDCNWRATLNGLLLKNNNGNWEWA